MSKKVEAVCYRFYVNEKKEDFIEALKKVGCSTEVIKGGNYEETH